MLENLEGKPIVENPHPARSLDKARDNKSKF
jgi:hypothetical protein